MMKRITTCLFILTLFFTGQSLSGQSADSKIQFHIGIGGSLPVGAFARNNVEESLIASEDFPGFAEGVRKSDNGFAELGFQYNARVGVQLLGITLSVMGEQAIHSIKRQEIGSFLSTRYNTELNYEQDDYNRRALLFGVGKDVNISSLNIGFSFLLGPSELDFPGFSYTYPGSDFIVTRFTADTENLSNLTYGLDVRVQYLIGTHLTIGSFLNYQQANYEYSYDLIGRPGGSSVLRFDDRVSYRKIDLGIFLGIHL